MLRDSFISEMVEFLFIYSFDAFIIGSEAEITVLIRVYVLQQGRVFFARIPASVNPCGDAAVKMVVPLICCKLLLMAA